MNKSILAGSMTLLSLILLNHPLIAEEPKLSFIANSTRGAATFQSICAHCHTTSYNESPIGAPGLRGVLERHNETWLDQWLKSPEAFAKTNETAKDLIDSNKFGLAMPTLPAMHDAQKRADIIAYLKTLQ